MICPFCGNPCVDHAQFCNRCGCNLRPPEAPRRGSHWVPILIMVVLSALGLGLFFALPGDTAAAEEPPAVEDTITDAPWFYIVDRQLYFDESLYTGGGKVVIPETVDGQTVVQISSGCFRDCTWITTVVLPDTVQIINSSAFAGCTSLRGIAIPESVMSIGAEAFSGCIALEALTISSHTTQLGRALFWECVKLRYIYFDGTCQQWQQLCSQKLGPFVTVYCQDGNLSQN